MWSKKNGAAAALRDLPGIESVQALMHDAEAVLKATAGESGDILRDARGRLEKTLRTARNSFDELDTDAMARKARRAVRVTDRYVRGHPWPIVLAGLGIGLLIGLAAARNRD